MYRRVSMKVPWCFVIKTNNSSNSITLLLLYMIESVQMTIQRRSILGICILGRILPQVRIPFFHSSIYSSVTFFTVLRFTFTRKTTRNLMTFIFVPCFCTFFGKGLKPPDDLKGLSNSLFLTIEKTFYYFIQRHTQTISMKREMIT